MFKKRGPGSLIMVAENPAIFDEIDQKVRAHFGLIDAPETEAAVASEEAVAESDELVLDLDSSIEIEE